MTDKLVPQLVDALLASSSATDVGLEMLDELIPRVPPAGWAVIMREPGVVAAERWDGIRIIFSALKELDGNGKRWLHLSVSLKEHPPSWMDLRIAKDAWIGKDRLAVQVIPRAVDHYNLHPRVLHLWACLDGDPVPDFLSARKGHI
jgi:hypothetical protein